MMDIRAMAGMTDMIKAMLPYEYDYKPVTEAGKTAQEIFELLSERSPALKEFEGFIGHILKQMDTKKDTAGADRMLMEVWSIINKHYPPNHKAHDYPPEEKQHIGEKITRDESQRYGV